MSDKVNLARAFAQISAPWTPHIVGQLNGQEVKLARARGAFVWHHHAEVDELFFVVKGTLDMHVRDAEGNERVVRLEPGELYIVPRGTEHKPVAVDGDAELLLFEPQGTVNTGNVIDSLTREARIL